MTKTGSGPDRAVAISGIDEASEAPVCPQLLDKTASSCAQCKVSPFASTKQFLGCAKCHSVDYCSIECQKSPQKNTGSRRISLLVQTWHTALKSKSRPKLDLIFRQASVQDKGLQCHGRRSIPQDTSRNEGAFFTAPTHTPSSNREEARSREAGMYN